MIGYIIELVLKAVFLGGAYFVLNAVWGFDTIASTNAILLILVVSVISNEIGCIEIYSSKDIEKVLEEFKEKIEDDDKEE